jgi:hypothetical protein
MKLCAMTQTDHDKAQADKFRDMARELECDEDEAAFEDKVRKVATAPKPEVEADK